MSAIRIMIVENDPGRIQILNAALSKQEGIDIVSTVSTRETAIKQIVSDIDIMIMNPAVLKEHTISRFIHSVQAKSPHTRIIYLIQKGLSDEHLISDIKAGLRGHMKITDSPAIMVKAIHAVNEGEIWATRGILEKAISKPMILPETIQAQVPGLPPLTNREMEMLTLVLQGASNKEIADRSSISERTVKTHLYRVYRKLNVKSRTKAIALLSHP
ncbi:MAG TPA: response regulator transcription factor [Nitrospirota bacterium]